MFITQGKMKKTIIALTLAALCLFSACGSRENAAKQENVPDDQSNISVESDMMESEVSEVERSNRAIIADALGADENARSIRFIMNSLNTINVGRIQSAELTQENGEAVLDLITEDQKNYRIYLTGSKKVDSIKDLTTGEWLITSDR